jgi:hypothetical protein
MRATRRQRATALSWVVLAVAVLLLGAAPALAGKPCRPPEVKVQLLAVNDLHGALDGARISKVGGLRVAFTGVMLRNGRASRREGAGAAV